MWSEEELRDVPDPPRPQPTGARARSAHLRRELSARNLARASALPHDLTRGAAVIYTPHASTHGNFIDASYTRICANPDWRRRLRKAHTAKRQGLLTSSRQDAWCELDSASSSDALLMNIFCYPRLLASAPLRALLGIERALEPIFGFKPRIPLQRNLVDTTEIDLRLGDVLVEAKLTESGFPSAPLRKLERYRDLDKVFDRALLGGPGDTVSSYQLLRGVLAAHALNASFCLLSDARRPDLIDAWHAVMRSVRSYSLQSRLRLLTWQELASVVPGPLAIFLQEKYGIVSAPEPRMARAARS